MDPITLLRMKLSQLTEGLANLSLNWVLVAVGVMMLALAVLRLTSRPRDHRAAWLIENIQVVLSVVVVVFLIIRPFLFQAFYIPSESMEPTLLGPHGGSTAGDRLLVNKLIYLVSNPNRFDIAVFHAPPAASMPDDEHPLGKEFIKRVIGLPNETVEVVGPRLLVDGRTLLDRSEGASVPLSSEERGSAQEIRGNEADLKVGGFSSSDLKVVAEPQPEVKFSPSQVLVNGKVELEDKAARIQETTGVATYGGDPGLDARVYVVEGKPGLVVVKGQKLQQDPGHVIVTTKQGKQRLDEPYTKEAPGYTMAPKHLGGNEYFMMGDNRNNSNDSHMWGALTRERVIGRAEILFWPLNRIHIFHWWLISVIAGMFLAYHLVQRALTPREG
jgi:signal peptidase I